jgi:hypothetical protein
MTRPAAIYRKADPPVPHLFTKLGIAARTELIRGGHPQHGTVV